MRRTTPRASLVLFALALSATLTVAFAASASARAWLGVVTQEITGDLRDGMDLHDPAGVLVNRVVDGSPADRAGIREGDAIVRFNSRAVDSPEALQRLVADSREGQEVALEIVRHGDHRTVSAKLASRPASMERMEAPEAPEPPDADEPPTPPTPPSGVEDGHGKNHVHVKVYGNGEKGKVYTWEGGDGKAKVYSFNGDDDEAMGEARKMLRNLPQIRGGDLEGMGNLSMLMGPGRARLGVRTQSLNEDLAGALGAPGKEGVLVLEVLDDTPASRAGLRAGDVILGVNGDSVKDAEDLVKTLRGVEGKASISVSRKGERRTVEAELEPSSRSNDDGNMIWRGRRGGAEQERSRIRQDPGTDDLRQQVEELRQQLRELRKQLDDPHHP